MESGREFTWCRRSRPDSELLAYKAGEAGIKAIGVKGKKDARENGLTAIVSWTYL